MITPAQYQEMVAKLERNNIRSAPSDAVEMESDLRDDLEALCKSRGWLYIRARSDKRSTIAVGWPDFSIFMEHGKSCFLELKRKGGKATTEQLATIAHLKKLGHVAEIVQSMSEVSVVIEKGQQ